MVSIVLISRVIISFKLSRVSEAISGGLGTNYWLPVIFPAFDCTQDCFCKLLRHVKWYVLLVWELNAFAMKFWCQGQCRLHVISVGAIPSYRSYHIDLVFPDSFHVWYILNEGLVLVFEEVIHIIETRSLSSDGYGIIDHIYGFACIPYPLLRIRYHLQAEKLILTVENSFNSLFCRCKHNHIRNDLCVEFL